MTEFYLLTHLPWLEFARRVDKNPSVLSIGFVCMILRCLVRLYRIVQLFSVDISATSALQLAGMDMSHVWIMYQGIGYSMIFIVPPSHNIAQYVSKTTYDVLNILFIPVYRYIKFGWMMETSCDTTLNHGLGLGILPIKIRLWLANSRLVTSKLVTYII